MEVGSLVLIMKVSKQQYLLHVEFYLLEIGCSKSG